MGDAIQSPLRLDGCRLCRLVIEAEPCSNLGGGASDFQLGFDFDVEEVEPTAFRVLLGVHATRPDGPAAQSLQRIEVVLEGRFSVPLDTPEETVRQLVPLNCFAMLYGVARGIVAQATGLTADGCVWLPSVNFLAILQNAAREAAEAQPPAARKATPRKRPSASRMKRGR
jgi:preprotein translocase subunit SecB